MSSGEAFPRLVIGAPQGRSGKTTITLGICAALAGRGLAVQPFKKGPDYIDPSWLSEAAGRACRNLDLFFLSSPARLQQAFIQGTAGADISLIEGNHGLYDSLDEAGMGSSAALARYLGHTPIILVVNAARMSRSVAALVRGYQTFEPNTNLAAVILNNVARSRHEHKLRQAIEKHCHIPVIGAFPRSDAYLIPDRHLGLVPRAEEETLLPVLAACREAAEQYIDLEALLAIARQAEPLTSEPRPAPEISAPKSRIGVIRDRAFTFYYPENLEALQEAGAELFFIDALRDSRLPPVRALYIGGGFPEIFMDELAANHDLRREIRRAAEDGLPIYAECGGLIYLARRIIWGDRTAEMVGALPCEVELMDRPQGHGFVVAETDTQNPFLPVGTILRGHEFHNSRLINWEELPTAYSLKRGNGVGQQRDGLIHHNILAAYTHLHAQGSPGWARAIVKKAR